MKSMTRKSTVKIQKQSHIFKSAEASQEMPVQDSMKKRLEIKIEEEGVDDDFECFDRPLRKAASSNKILNDDDLRVMRATQVVVAAHVSPTNLK